MNYCYKLFYLLRIPKFTFQTHFLCLNRKFYSGNIFSIYCYYSSLPSIDRAESIVTMFGGDITRRWDKLKCYVNRNVLKIILRAFPNKFTSIMMIMICFHQYSFQALLPPCKALLDRSSHYQCKSINSMLIYNSENESFFKSKINEIRRS